MSDSDRSSRLQPSELTRHLVSNRDLIVQVRKQPCLWDRQSPEYHDREKKEKAWKLVYSYFYPDFDSLNKSNKLEIGHLITKKWYNVRDAYKKSIKGGPKSRAQSRPYVYADLLTFLGLPSSADTKPDRSSAEIDHEKEEPSNWYSEVFVDVDNEDVEENDAPNPLDRTNIEYEYNTRANETTDDTVDDNIVSVLANLIKKEEDEDRAFFKSITPAVKRLPDHAKFTFRIQVMKLLKRLQARDRSGGGLKRERPGHLETTARMDTDSE